MSEVERDKKKTPKAASKKPTRPASRPDQENAESAVLEAYAKMPESDRRLGERLHEIIKANAPLLSPKLWYGMPAYARNGKVVCFFQSAAKFKTRYATLGFMHEAKLDEGGMWPTAFAVVELTKEVEAAICKLVQRAVG